MSKLTSLLTSGQSKAANNIVSRKDYLVLGVISVLALLLGAGIAQATAADSQSNNAQITTSSSQPDSVSGFLFSMSELKNLMNQNQIIGQQIQSYRDSSQTNSNDSNTTVRVNNHEIQVPENGTVNRSITTENGNVDVHIESNNSQSSSTNGRSSSNHSHEIEIESNSNVSSESSVNQEVEISRD